MTTDSLTMTSYSLTLVVLMVFSFVCPGASQTVYTDANCGNACPEMSSCMQTAENSYICECEYGYEQLTPGAACEDKDECVTDDNDCGELGVCTNTDGGYYCECPPGYIYDDSNLYCTDIDECTDNLDNCEEGCTNTIGGFTCECGGDKVLNADGRSCSNECLYEVHNCYGENPCNPLCESGVKKYRAKFQRRFIDCGNDGSCTEKKCGRSSIWDQSTEKCLRWGLTVLAVDARPRILGRCGANQNQHNCRANNPCAPTRCEADVYFYKGASNNKYVECLEDGTCIERTCPRGQDYIAGSCQ